MTDLMDRLADHRPTGTELDRMWEPSRREAVLQRVLAGPRRRRRRAPLLAAAAVLLAVPLVHEVVAPDAAEARADLLALAAVADGPDLAPGQLLHLRSHSEQDNRWPHEDGRDYVNDRESWVGYDGSLWFVETRPGEEWTDYAHLAASGRPDLHDPSPAFAATLPTDPDAFRAYLEPRVSGSNSHEEALYEAVANLIRSHFLPPATLSAALGALADVEGVRTEDVTVAGRDAVRISYRRFGVAFISEDSVTVDRATAQPLSDESRSVQSHYESTNLSSEVVTALPPEVQAVFERYPDGARLCADGEPPVTEDC